MIVSNILVYQVFNHMKTNNNYEVHMLRKLQPAKKTLKHQQAGELSSCSIQSNNKKMKNDNVLISSLDLSVRFCKNNIGFTSHNALLIKIN